MPAFQSNQKNKPEPHRQSANTQSPARLADGTKPGQSGSTNQKEQAVIPPNDRKPPGLVQATPAKEKKKKRRRRWPWIVLAVVILALAVGGYFGYRAYAQFHKVIQKNVGESAIGLQTQEIEPAKLKAEGEGRVNILLLGIGDPGHAGEKLTDSIIVASYDPKTNDVAMLSLPRDLYVNIAGGGQARINTAFYYGEERKKGGGPETVKKTVSNVLGIPIHYYIKVDFSALKQAVDAVGGVDVKVEKTLVDPEYPCEKNESKSCGYSILAGQQHFNGSAALKYARCRKGDCGDDYGRAKRQQEILVALRQKAGTQNFFNNIGKINEVLQIIGDNVTTDLQLGEIERLAKITKGIDPTKLSSKVFDNGPGGLVKNGAVGEASVVIPAAGVGNYSAIQAFVRQLFADGYLKQEAATVEVDNGTTVPSKAQVVADLLKTYNYNVIKVGVADATTYKKTIVIDYTDGKKPYTTSYLQKRFGVVATKATPEQIAALGENKLDIRIIVGSDYKTF